MAHKAEVIESVLCRKLDSFTPSPVLTEYRNNQSYAFGYKNDGSGDTDVGLYVTKKSVCVVPCEADLNGSRIAKTIARATHDWILLHPVLPLIDKEAVTGFWRHIHIRETRTMNVSVTVEALAKDGHLMDIWNSLVPDYCAYILEQCKKNGWTLADIYAQYTMTLQEASNHDPFTLLIKHCEFIDTLDRYKFRRSPDSFFQPNTHTALIIYNQVREMAAKFADEDTYLLDICCGTGTIGIYVSSLYKQVIGVDRTTGSIEDARYNAVLISIPGFFAFLIASSNVSTGFDAFFLPKSLRSLNFISYDLIKVSLSFNEMLNLLEITFLMIARAAESPTS